MRPGERLLAVVLGVVGLAAGVALFLAALGLAADPYDPWAVPFGMVGGGGVFAGAMFLVCAVFVPDDPGGRS